jgi:hypothetical protein
MDWRFSKRGYIPLLFLVIKVILWTGLFFIDYQFSLLARAGGLCPYSPRLDAADFYSPLSMRKGRVAVATLPLK